MMKKRMSLAFFILSVGCCFFVSPCQAKYSGGTGEPNDPYQIADANDMNEIGTHSGDWGAHFVLVNDINLAEYTGTQFNIIGNSITRFTGVFDGNNHKIVNFTYSSTATGPVGLFSYVDGVSGVEAEIKDLTLIDPNIDVPTGNPVGALVGELSESKIYGCCVEGGKVLGGGRAAGLVGSSVNSAIWDCYSSANVKSNGGEAGGLVCENWRSYIFNCHTAGTVDGFRAGGLVAINDEATISNCYSACNVLANARGSGGLVGVNNNMILNSYSNGNVSGNEEVGGLVGENYGTVVNCYAVGNISGTSKVGGLVGHINSGTVSRCYSAGVVEGNSETGGFGGHNEGTISDCYWDTVISNQQSGVGAGDANGVSGKTIVEMKQQLTFVNWDFVEFWAIEEGTSYPYLRYYGCGTADDPYLICGPKRMQSIGTNPYIWDKHFKLIANIDLSAYTGTEYNIIGNWFTPFTGVFDGNGHTISNFRYADRGGNQIGIFGFLDNPNALITNLTLINPIIDVNYPGSSVGTLVGSMHNGNVSNCAVEGGIIYAGAYGTGGLIGRIESGDVSNCHASISIYESSSWTDWVGGLIGNNNNGTISNCSATGFVRGKETAGGLVGENTNGDVSGCYATGSVSGWSRLGGLIGNNEGSVARCFAISEITATESAECIGGLIGTNESDVSDCYAICDINATEKIGGLVGVNWSAGSITNCFAAGKVDGYTNVGGLIGYDQSASYSACFWDSDVNPDVNGIGNTTNLNVIAKSTSQMRLKNTYTDVGWDFIDKDDNGFEDFWRMCIDGQGYPKLSWEFTKSDFVCPDGVDIYDLAVLCEQWLAEEIPEDLSPSVGDGIVNFADFAVFADQWDISKDIYDLNNFAEQWLKVGLRRCSADISPLPGGDGVVNMLDFAIFAEHWLAGVE